MKKSALLAVFVLQMKSKPVSDEQVKCGLINIKAWCPILLVSVNLLGMDTLWLQS